MNDEDEARIAAALRSVAFPLKIQQAADDFLEGRPNPIIDRLRSDIQSDPIHPEGIYACDGCNRTYAEYVNGCVFCWDDDLTAAQNRVKYPARGVSFRVPE